MHESGMDWDDTAGWVHELSLPYRNDPRRIILPDVKRSRDLIAPELRAAINKVVTGQRPWPLFIHGPAGTGKTFAALCLCDSVGSRCQYITAAEMADELIAASKGEYYDEGLCHCDNRLNVLGYWHRWRHAPLAVLDELGTRRKVSDFAYECVKRALDAREGKPIILISNVGPDALEALYDQRIASRCCAGTVVELVGEDRRIAGKVG